MIHSIKTFTRRLTTPSLFFSELNLPKFWVDDPEWGGVKYKIWYNIMVIFGCFDIHSSQSSGSKLCQIILQWESKNLSLRSLRSIVIFSWQLRINCDQNFIRTYVYCMFIPLDIMSNKLVNFCNFTLYLNHENRSDGHQIVFNLEKCRTQYSRHFTNFAQSPKPSRS